MLFLALGQPSQSSVKGIHHLGHSSWSSVTENNRHGHLSPINFSTGKLKKMRSKKNIQNLMLYNFCFNDILRNFIFFKIKKSVTIVDDVHDGWPWWLSSVTDDRNLELWRLSKCLILGHFFCVNVVLASIIFPVDFLL